MFNIVRKSIEWGHDTLTLETTSIEPKGRCISRRINSASRSRGCCLKQVPTPTTTKVCTIACNTPTTST